MTQTGRVATDSEVREIYGYCLHLAGITDADRKLDLLLGTTPEMFFSHYVEISWFTTFANDVLYYTKKQAELMGISISKSKLKRPTRNQSISKHFVEGFKPAFQ